MKLSAEHQSALTELLTWRRDVRHFKRDAIAPDLLERIKRAVDFAPSVGNSRPWRMVQVTSAEGREAIIETFEASNRQAGARYDRDARSDYAALKLAGLREAPVVLAVFTEPDPAAGRGLGRQTMPETLTYSTVMAIHTLWLFCRSHNVGVGWVSILDPDAVTKALDVPGHWSLTAVLCLGYPAEEHDTPELHRAGWQEDSKAEWLER
ncbi:MAG: 5,6-dimethylbenzimidazole synthase [Pseudomonadota bacterium]